MLVDRFKKDMSYVGIANKYGKSKSNVSQIFDTLFHHLRLLFMHDEKFLYMDYARELKRDYLTEIKSVFDEIKDEVLGDGENPKVIQILLGHKDVTTTIRSYNSVDKSYFKQATKKIDAMFGSDMEM